LIVGILGGILGAVGVVASIILGTIAYKRAHQQDIESDATMEATLNADIKYIKQGVDDIKTEQRSMTENMVRLSERVTRVEESVKGAHRRLDQHLGTILAEMGKDPCKEK